MNRQEFKELWDKCILPLYEKMREEDDTLFIREGSFESLCRSYNDIKNSTKRLFMLNNKEKVILDRHKIAACLAKAIALEKPIYKEITDEYTGKEDEFFIANELLAFGVALSIMRAYIELKLEKRVEGFVKREAAYARISKEDFVFPDTILNVDYRTSVCWAWHHNIISGHFDVLGTANLLFMIENYSVEAYSK